jgi:hypothetical protein
MLAEKSFIVFLLVAFAKVIGFVDAAAFVAQDCWNVHARTDRMIVKPGTVLRNCEGELCLVLLLVGCQPGDMVCTFGGVVAGCLRGTEKFLISAIFAVLRASDTWSLCAIVATRLC